jgi:pimeloyl-ACP methyl ester carboxylesterase
MMNAVGILTNALRRPQTYAGAAREALSMAQCAVRYPLGMIEAAVRTGRPRNDGTHDTPVVLVHGYGHNRSGWFVLDRALRNAGFSSVHTMNYVAWGHEGVPELAARLARRVEAVRRLTGADKVHVVGHSMGGVLLRYYVQVLGGAEFVDTAITIASPHEGTVTALAGVGRGARDLRPGSRVMRRLAAPSPAAAGVRWHSFYSNLDVFVQPSASAVLRHPDLHATNVLAKDHGHVTILLAPVVARSIVAQLEASEVSSGDVLPMRRRPSESVAA